MSVNTHWIVHTICFFALTVLIWDKLQFHISERTKNSKSPRKPILENIKSYPTTIIGRKLLEVNDDSKRVLITGISGMIGSAVAEVMLKRKWEVHGLVRWRSNVHNLKNIITQLHLHYGDIQDPHLMHKVIDEIRPHLIYHFAAQAYNGVSWTSPAYTLSANILGTLNILEPLRALGMNKTKVVVAGSSTEYGHTANIWKGPIPETAPLNPVTPYGVSKVATEMLARQYFYSYGIPIVVIRFFVHVGTGHTEVQAIQSFCMQVAEIEAGIKPPILRVGRLDTSRDITDIKDAAPVVADLAEKGVPGEAYNMASGKAIEIKQLLNLILSLSKNNRIQVKHDASRLRAYDENILLGDNSKVRNITGWVPKPDYKRTVNDILNYWRSEISMRHNSKNRRVNKDG